MHKYQTIQDWSDLIDNLFLKGGSIAIGVFDLNGQMLDANEAMYYFLDTNPLEKKPKNSFVNPLFIDFCKKSTDEEEIFEGVLTIGNLEDISYSLEAKVFRRNGYILVFAEADVRQLFVENKKMSRLNQEVNNLQRQLIKEKVNLQETLKALKETQLMLVHSEKMNAMGKLVAGVAHEVNNPIAFVYSNMFSIEKGIDEIIRSYIELEELIQINCNAEIVSKALETREKNDLDFLMNDLTDMTKQSKTGIQRVKTIVEDLRNFSRLDEAEIKLIELIRNIFATVSIASLEFSERNIQYEFIAPEKLMIECYPGQLNQALLNVIINATQAIESGGKIIIIVKEDELNVHITVSDNGCGIPESIKDKIFDPFFTTKPVGRGTGLGLSITYKIIVELHKGTLKVDSNIGKGTSITMSIPKRQIVLSK